MKKKISTPARLAALTLTALLASTGALADKGDKGGKHGHGNKHEQRDDDRRYDDRRNDISIQVYFGNNDRRIVNEYYAPEFRAGHCPPGLAKKGNGCMPPGQAKKWRKGQPLPQGVAYYELPHDLVYRMPPPPPRHRYVRVGSDILLLSIGSGIVVDAMIDIGR
ncbi:MAG: RcnB family protein [Azonexus sp.]|jgi:Ni/Co efflux regulator RcnB